MIVYWPSLSEWETCKQQYLWRRGFPQIDVGGGLGKPMPRPQDDSKSDDHAMVGSIVQRVIELFYKQHGWEWGQEQALEWVEETAQEEMDRAIRYQKNSRPYWKLSPFFNYREARSGIIKSVRGFVKTCHHNQLFGPVADPEAQLTGRLREDPVLYVRGRLDLFLVRNEVEGPLVLDGKNGKEFWDAQTKSFQMHVDLDQLIFYALIVRLITGRVPVRLGIIPYRYPVGYDWSEERERLLADPQLEKSKEKQEILQYYQNRPVSTGVVWYECSLEMVEEMASRVLAFNQEWTERLQSIPSYMTPQAQMGFTVEAFPPTLHGECKFCNYESACPDRQAALLEIRSRRPAESGPFVDNKTQVEQTDLDCLDQIFLG